MFKNFAVTVLLVATSFTMVGCSTTPDKPSDTKPSFVYNKPIATVQQAAVGALTANGFEIGKSEPQYVEGARPHKVGALVGSGGETAGVWLTATTSTSTSVQVDTAKSFVGMAGQKNWNTEIIADMDKTIGAHN